MSSTTSTRRRLVTVAASAVLALGLGAGLSGCASSAGGSAQDQVAAANDAAAHQSDVAAATYQKLSASITTAMDLATEAQTAGTDSTLLANLTAATDAARELDPVATYRPFDDVADAQDKLHALEAATEKMTAAKATLDAAITAVQGALG